MFKNVLVGVDGGYGGLDAIALGCQLAAPDGKLTLAHVFGPRVVPSHAITPDLVEEERDAAARTLEDARRQAQVEAAILSVQSPSPGRGLHDAAEDLKADVLVLGTCHRGAVGRAMLGDDTRAAIDGAPCAVAVAPKLYAAAVRPFASIGVGFDGSPESAAAIDVATALAEPTNARVRALQVVTIPTYSYTGMVGPIFEGVDKMVSEAAKRAGSAPGVEGLGEFGITGEELAKFSGEVDLLIVGSRGYGPLHRMITGSTARYLERHARGPLLILPRGSRYAAPTLPTSGAAASEASVHA